MIDIGPLAERAQAQGVPSAQRFMLADGTAVDFEVSAEGLVTMRTPGWSADVADGTITGFRPVPADPMGAIQMGAVQMHEMYLTLRRAGFSILAAAAYLAATIRYNGEDPQADQK